jgi:hypothetical protein
MPRDNAIFRRQRAAAAAARQDMPAGRPIPLRPGSLPTPTAAEAARNAERAAAIKQFWTEIRKLDAAASSNASDEVALLAMREEPPAGSGGLLSRLVRPAGGPPQSLVQKLNHLRSNGEAKAPTDGALHELMDGDS